MVNGWGLFFLISVPMSVAVIIQMLGSDLSNGAGISAMIGYSVRIAVPFIYLAMAFSSLKTLFPGEISAWCQRNRRYIGLCFAVGMAWQGVFIFTMSTFFREFYTEDIYYFRDELEGSVGYLFLTAMVMTSFRVTRKHLSSRQWQYIHQGGIYFLWAYAFSVYWWNLYYYEGPRLLDYVYYWAGFTAFALRIAAWGKNRLSGAQRIAASEVIPLWYTLAGGSLIIFGLGVAASGLYWQKAVSALLTAPTWSAELELWLPFWPLEPFLSLLIIGLGTAMITMRPDPAVSNDAAHSVDKYR